MNKIKNFFSRHWALIIILILGFLPLTWFKDGLFIAGGDNHWLLDPRPLFYDSLYTWSNLKSAGAINFTVGHIFPLPFIWVLLKSFGLSLLVIERIWAVIFFATPAISIYYLVTRLFSNSKTIGFKIAGLMAALLYSLNMFIINSPLNPVLLPVLAVLPLIFLWWVKALNQKKFSWNW